MPEAGMRPLPWCPFHACAVLVSLAVPVSVDGSHDCCHDGYLFMVVVTAAKWMSCCRHVIFPENSPASWLL